MRIFILAVVVVVMVGSVSRVCQAQEPTTTGLPSVTAKQPAADLEQLRTAMNQLTTENERLRTKVTELERRLRNRSIREHMIQEEERAEKLEEQLFSIARQEANLQAQLDEVNEQLRPENIQQIQVLGSLRPEEVRESTRRRLANTQMRVQAQLQLLQQNRTRIQSSITVTDMLIQNLRAQMQSASHP